MIGSTLWRQAFLHRPWSRGLLRLGLASLATLSAHAQLNYLSDNRSVSGFARIDANAYAYPPNFVTSYSGDYSGSEMPSSPFADVVSDWGGTTTMVVGWTNAAGQPMPPNSVSATVYGSQTSFLHPQELSFSGGGGGYGSPAQFPNLPPGASAQASSILQVSFSVSAPVAFTLSCEGIGDPLACNDSYTLASASLGVLSSGSTGQMVQQQQYGAPIDYSGIFNPGDIYTLNLSSVGVMDGGGLNVDLVAVPEPGVAALGILGLGRCLRRQG